MNSTRRHFVASLVFTATLSKWEARAEDTHADSVRSGMIDYARKHLHETDWAPRTELLSAAKSYYCNIFVADVAREAGGATWDPIKREPSILPDRDPVAREWADPGFMIKGWSVAFADNMSFDGRSPKEMLARRKFGDIVSGGGHVGIVSDDHGASLGQVFSASSISGAVELNDWSFRLPDHKKYTTESEWTKAAESVVRRFTVRRFVGI